jgi:hypothetical protein
LPKPSQFTALKAPEQPQVRPAGILKRPGPTEPPDLISFSPAPDKMEIEGVLAESMWAPSETHPERIPQVLVVSPVHSPKRQGRDAEREGKPEAPTRQEPSAARVGSRAPMRQESGAEREGDRQAPMRQESGAEREGDRQAPMRQESGEERGGDRQAPMRQESSEERALRTADVSKTKRASTVPEYIYRPEEQRELFGYIIQIVSAAVRRQALVQIPKPWVQLGYNKPSRV